MSELKTNKVSPATGTTLVIGDSGDTVDLSANTLSLPTNTVANAHLADDAVGVAELSATGTASASTFLRGDNSWATAGGSSFPIGASAHIGGSHQTDATGTITKLNFNTELYDPNSNFNTTTYAYTVPSGQAGKYLVTAFAGAQALGDGIRMNVQIYKNNSSALTSYASASCNFS